MAKYNYISKPINYSEINSNVSLDSSVIAVVEDFTVNSFFDQKKHTLALEIYSLDNTLLYENKNYPEYSQLLNSAGAGKEGASNLTLDPVQDAIKQGFETGDVNVVYKFNNDPYSLSTTPSTFFIESISPDRTEFRAYPKNLDEQNLKPLTDEFVKRLNDESYFSEFNVNFAGNYSTIGLNIATDVAPNGLGIVIKTYNPLPSSISNNSEFSILESVGDTVAYTVTAEVLEDILKVPFLKGPNFSIEIEDENKTSTEFLNYNELFSYPVSNSYYEIYSLFNEKSSQISINHNEYSDFIHFSSAEERLRNFKYKLDLIHSYEDSLTLLSTSSISSANSSGSVEYYNGLIEGIVNNFDHYDRFLYYESGSYNWPKTNSTKPYINQKSTEIEATAYFNSQLVSASNYDNSNNDILTNTIPVFIREDQNNEPYIMFIHMIAQHFDNLWIYFKAVTDKNDADSRLDFGISKDLVRTAIESYGIKLENSNTNTGTLFNMYSGEGLVTGSELITSQSIILAGTDNEHLQPVPQDNYQKEIYKRIYHNIPYLVKSKGTQRGLRALINCYGIPEDILKIKTHGGVRINDDAYISPLSSYTSSIDKVRLDTTGSYVTGSTLSKYTSIVKKGSKYSDDQHTIEIGFDISENTNKYINTQITSSFSIDDYIGDPRNRYEGSYEELDKLSYDLLNHEVTWEDIYNNWENANWNWDDYLTYTNDPFAFIRMVKFFDTSLFRTIKQFIPARANLSTGVIVKPHILDRSKAKQVEVSIENKIYTGSIQTGFITGSDGDSFGVANKAPYTTNYSASYTSPIGKVERNVTDESPRVTGEFSGSLIIATDGELNSANPFKKQGQPLVTMDITVFNLSLPIPPSCFIELTAEYIGEYYKFTPTGGGTGGTISITYPQTIGPTTSPISYNADFDIYEFFTVQATANYPYTFDGWYTLGGTLITANNTLSIYYEDEPTNGYLYEARFSSTHTDPEA